MNYISTELIAYYKRAAEAEGMLSAAEERALTELYRVNGCQAALNRIIVSHQFLILKVLRDKFKHHYDIHDELMQQGNLGLMRAIKDFQPERSRFSTYSYNWVFAAMQEHIRDNASVVRRAHGTDMQNFKKALKKLGYQQRELGDEEYQAIALEMDTSVKRVIRIAHKLNTRDKSLNAPLKEDGEASWEDMLVSNDLNPEEQAQAKQAISLRTEWLARAFEVLSPRERGIIEARQLGEKPLSFKKLGAELGVSAERVRQIEETALQKMTRFVQKNFQGPLVSHDAFYDPTVA